jgi:hypothetical protein
MRRKLNLLTVLSFVALAVVLVQYVYSRRIRVSETKTALARVTEEAAQTIRARLMAIESVTNALALRIASGGLTEEELTVELKTAVGADPMIVEAGIAYVRGKGPKGPGLYAPHYGIRQGGNALFRLEQAYDYTSVDWFKETLAQGAGWTEPYFGQATRSWVVGYAMPIYAGSTAAGESPIGVVRVNYALRQIRREIASLPLGSEGYACIARLHSTRVIYHPVDSFVKDHLTLYDIAAKRKDATLKRMADDIAEGKPGIAERPATMTGELAWNIYRPIAGTNWNLVLVFIKAEALGDAHQDRHDCMILAVALVLAVAFASLRLLRVEMGAPWRLWAATGIVTLTLASAVGCIWRLSFDPRVFNDVQRGMIFDPTGLQRFQGEREEMSRQQGEPDPIFIPTGMVVTSVEFKSAADVTMKGYIWQKIPLSQRERIAAGFELTDAIEAQVSEAYRNTHDDYEVRGYGFRATLRQQFDFRHYPLDFQRIRVVVGRKDLSNNVIFVPDLGAYPSMIPQTRPGLERSFTIAGWQVEKTFFNYATLNYSTDFGIEHFVGSERQPALAYNVVVRRDFRSPFIANIVPLMLIAGIGFALLSMIHREQDRVTAYDARGGRVTGTSAALFFALLLAHIRLRNELVGLRETIYIEYFYFIMYVSCLAIVADALVVASRTPPKWMLYRDNFIPKLIYWPALLLLVFLTTIAFFW